ncbi:hypothetical protein ACFY3V_27055 [Streptosporangium sp. NPDC000095]|uniref:hypothetical protein n=1 Tax=Streptosporangium sp. NPDC000095 TaxID=3366184 RepID=UPI00367860AC
MALVVIDPDSTQAVPAPGRHRVRHWEDSEGYRTRPPYAPPASPPHPAADADDPRTRFPATADATETRTQPSTTADATDPRTRPPATTGPGVPSSAAGPAAPTPSTPAGPPSGSGHGRPIYREEALRRHADSRAAAKMPLVISGPSFLLLWIVVAAVLAAGATLITLVLGAGG